MDLVRVYQCLCDRARMRIAHLLAGGPLCVCHLQEIMGEPQVKISKHLACLQACVRENTTFSRDAKRAARLHSTLKDCVPFCAC